ncbi:8771_t:CDS:2 [Funneliformis geosporum]|nr:8771_t:CDS:2 [Funneliformis geosporum]
MGNHRMESSSVINTNYIADLYTTSTEFVILSEQVVEKLIPKESFAESAITYVIIPRPYQILYLANIFQMFNEKYEKKVVTFSSENNISEQMAKMQIYDEMELYLHGKKRKYLCKMIQKAKNIYTLFKGIGIDKLGLVTPSADVISRLTDA